MEIDGRLKANKINVIFYFENGSKAWHKVQHLQNNINCQL